MWFHCSWEPTKNGWYNENSWSLFHFSLVPGFGQDCVQMYCLRKVNWGYYSTPLSCWIFKAIPLSNPQHYLDINRGASVHLWAVFPAWSDCTIISCFCSRSWCKTKMAETFVGCKEGITFKAQTDAVPREEWGGGCSVMLPVDCSSPGSRWIFLRRPWVNTWGCRWCQLCHEFMCHHTVRTPTVPSRKRNPFSLQLGAEDREQSITVLICLSWHNRLQISKSKADSDCSNMGLVVKMQIATGVSQLWRGTLSHPLHLAT